MKGKVLYLYGNRPEPLPVLMMGRLREVGLDVWLLYYDRGKSKVSLPMPNGVLREKSLLVRWPVGKSFILKAWNRLIVLLLFVRKVRSMDPKIIHAWNFDMLLAGYLAILGRPHCRLVFSLQDTTPWMITGWGQAIQRYFYRRVCRFFVTSSGFDSQFLRRFNLIQKSVGVTFIPNVPKRSKFEKFMPRRGSKFLTIGHIGLLRGNEGINTLIEASLSARKAGVDVRLFFAGKGPAEDLVRLAADKHDFIDFTGPFSHDQDIATLYQQVDVLYGVYDKSYDKKIHLAYRFCEAVNCRLPIIVAEETHMAELTNKFNVGRSVPLGNVKALANALEELADERVRQTISKSCDDARSQFVFESFEDELVCAYDALVSDKADQEFETHGNETM